MTLLLLVTLSLIALVCGWRKWRRTSIACWALAAISVLGIGCGPVAAILAGPLQAEYERKPELAWGQRNVILVPGAGIMRVGDAVEPGIYADSRLVEAATLYADCRKAAGHCTVLLSGGDPAGLGISEAKVYAQVLQSLGVGEPDIVLEPNSLHTWHNAQFSSELLRQHAPDYIALVSSGIHLRRSMLYLEHFGVKPVPVRSDYLRAEYSAVPLAYNFAVADFALHEYVGIARYYVYNLMGWNAPRVTASQVAAQLTLH